jgi:protein involved in polysaccharide export with SLBB domain
MVGSVAQAQVSSNLLISRADLTAAAARAEAAAAAGDPSTSAQTAAEAASMRQRLRDGDLQVGDRVIVTIVSDAVRRDTVVVGADRTLQLQGMIVVPVAGVLRSELEQRVSSEVLKYIKAEKVEVTPLMRLAVLGAVMKPGYFAFASDMPLGDAIMSAGGPSGTADVGRSIVKRGNQEYKSAGETSKAIAGGLTLDQFGMRAGDELVIGQRRDFGAGTLIGMTGAVASLLTLFVALRR